MKRNQVAMLLASVVLIAVVARLAVYNYFPQKYKEWVLQEAEKNQLPPELLYAVIHTESRFHPLAISSIGARGLMQITEETFHWVKLRMQDAVTTYDDLYIPEINIRYGSYLLRMLLDEFETIENALCAYHAGWGNVTRWLQNLQYSKDGVHLDTIPFPDTAHYLYKVERAQKIYEYLYN